MLTFIAKNKDLLTVLLISAFFLSLLFAPNDVNSKVIIALGLFSICFFDLDKLKTAIIQHYPLLILFLMICLSLAYTDALGIGLKKIQRVSFIPISIIIFSFIRPFKKIIQIILCVFVGAVLLATIYSHTVTLANFINNGESSYRNLFNLNYSYQSLGNTIGLHPTYYAYYILNAIIILLHFIRGNTVFLQKIALLLVGVYFSFFIVHLSSRIAIFILYVLIMYNILNYAFKHRMILKSIAFVFVFHALISFMVLNVGVTKYRFQHIIGFTYYTGYTVNDGSHKLKLWNAALKANKNVFFGNGMGDIEASLKEQFLNAGLTKPIAENYNSHNQYIEYYVGMGIIGLITFCYVLFYYVKVFYRNNNQIGFQLMCVTAIFCLTECLWSRHHGIVFSMLMIGLLQHLNCTKNFPKNLFDLKK